MIGSQKVKKRDRDKSLRDLWRTPRWVFEGIQKALNLTFDTDVACDEVNKLTENFVGVEKDALVSSWGEKGTVAFLNPPYSKIGPWIDAAIRERKAGVTTVMLIPMSLDTQWFVEAMQNGATSVHCVVGGRISFVEPDPLLGLVEVRGNPCGSMLVVFDSNIRNRACQLEYITLQELRQLGGYVPKPRASRKKPKKKAQPSESLSAETSSAV